jgi:hypothetical protein
VFIAVAVRNLDQAKPVPLGQQTHGFGVNCNRARGQHAFGEIFFVEIDSHIGKVLRPIAAG